MKQWSAIGIHSVNWLSIGLLVSGCRTWVEPTLYTVTRAKSPITYDSRHITVNKPLSEFDSENLNPENAHRAGDGLMTWEIWQPKIT